ncbi:MAG: glutathione peroxidase [Candidatus Margulisiibacteriota bacterium]|nr:glutathione peroxidase [Candidatus Margulisiibacteriota bacterium]
MKLLSLVLILIFGTFVFALGKNQVSSSNINSNKIYQFNLKTITGEPFNFNELEGKVVLIVNVASKCGFTNQYEGLQKIYQQFKNDGFVVIGIPSNNFGKQEPGNSKQIAEFCQLNYNVSFPLMEKSEVKGSQIVPLYSFLTDKNLHPKTGGDITWNFNKFLIDKNGHVYKRYSSFTRPNSSKVIKDIKKLLDS